MYGIYGGSSYGIWINSSDLLEIRVFDAVNAFDGEYLELHVENGEWEDLSVNEYWEITPLLLPALASETILVNEYVNLQVSIKISLSETISVSDFSEVRNPVIYLHQFDFVSISEFLGYFPDWIYVIDSPSVNVVSHPFVFDTVSATDGTPYLFLTSYNVQVFDVVSTDDFTSDVVPTIYLLSWDYVTVFENTDIAPYLPSFAYDSVGTADVPHLSIPILFQTNDSILAEDEPPFAFVTISVSEDETISVSDAFFGNESISFSVNETISSTDVVYLSIPILVFSFDLVLCEDIASVGSIGILITTFDSVSVYDYTSSGGELNVSAGEDVLLVDFVEVTIPINASTSDTVVCSDEFFAQVSLPVFLSDLVYVDEFLAYYPDLISVSDAVNLVLVQNVFAYEDILVTDGTPEIFFPILVVFFYDAILVDDVPECIVPTIFLYTWDDVLSSDSATGEGKLTFSSFDIVLVSELNDQKLNVFFLVFEDQTIVDIVTDIYPPLLFVYPGDDINVTDSEETHSYLKFTSIEDVFADDFPQADIQIFFLVWDDITSDDVSNLETVWNISVGDLVTPDDGMIRLITNNPRMPYRPGRYTGSRFQIDMKNSGAAATVYGEASY